MDGFIRQLLLLAATASLVGLLQRCDCKKEAENRQKNAPVSLVPVPRSYHGPNFEDVYNSMQDSIPLIIWHGSGDSAIGQDPVAKLVKEVNWRIPVYAIQVGKNEQEDEDATIWGDVESQIEKACQAIIDNKRVQEKGQVNFIGFSQGGLFVRGLIERCPLEEHSIKVHNFVSVGGPQQGVYGIPKAVAKNNFSSKLMSKGASMFAYKSYFQNKCVPASYWHNPKNNPDYRKKTFLADINNEGSTYHEEYKTRFKSINKLVLVKFNQDTIVQPAESAHFGFFKEGSTKQVEPMNETTLYQNDLIGLRYLNENKRADFMELDNDHLDFDLIWFRDKIIDYYFNPDRRDYLPSRKTDWNHVKVHRLHKNNSDRAAS